MALDKLFVVKGNKLVHSESGESVSLINNSEQTRRIAHQALAKKVAAWRLRRKETK